MLGLRTLRSAFSKLNLASLSSPSLAEGAMKPARVQGLGHRQRLPLAICQAANTCGRTFASWSSRWSSPPFLGSVDTTRTQGSRGPLSAAPQIQLGPAHSFSTTDARSASLYQMHKRGPIIKKRKNKNPLGDKPMARGVVLKTLIKKPRKPNSANRKCVLVRLSTGKELIAYVPGEGHSLQEHNIVMVRVGRLRDVPGVKVKCIRGVYDLAHVVKRKT